MTFAEFDRVHRRSLRTVNDVLGTRLFHREVPARDTQWEPNNYSSRNSSTLTPRVTHSRYDRGRDFQPQPQAVSYNSYQRHYEDRSGSLPRQNLSATKQTSRQTYKEDPSGQYRKGWNAILILFLNENLSWFHKRKSILFLDFVLFDFHCELQ